MGIIVDPLSFFTSYLGVNPSVGCTNGCGYCILDKDVPNPDRITKIATPKLTLDQLLRDEKVTKKNSLAFYNLSDPFLKQNIPDLLYILNGLEKQGHENIVVLITKLNPERTAPDQKALEKISRLKRLKPVIMVSYSNAPKEIEPVSKSARLELMAAAKSIGIPVVQYARPMYEPWTPRNKVVEMAKETAQIVDSIVIGGVLMNDNLKNKLEKRTQSVPTWTNKDGRKIEPQYLEFIVDAYKRQNPELGIVYNSSCAISCAFKIPHYMGYQWDFGILNKEGYCKKPCQAEQRQRCVEAIPPIKFYENKDEYKELRIKEEEKVMKWLKRFDVEKAMFRIKKGYINVFAEINGPELKWMRQHTGMYIRNSNGISKLKEISHIF